MYRTEVDAADTPYRVDSAQDERPFMDAWEEDDIDAWLDWVEYRMSQRMGKPVLLRRQFQERVHAAYGRTAAEAEEDYAALREQDELRYACPHCAETVELARERDGLSTDVDPGITTRAHTVNVAEERTLPDVMDRHGGTVDDLFALDDVVYTNFDGDDLRELQEDGVREGPVFREIYCKTHDERAYIAAAGEGEARIEDGMLRPTLVP